MSLLEKLTAAADRIDPSLLPTSNDVQKLAGAIVHFLEHGEAFLEAAERGVTDVSDLLTGQPQPDDDGQAEQPPAGAQPTTATPAVPDPAVPTPSPVGVTAAGSPTDAGPAPASPAAGSAPAPPSSPTQPADMSQTQLQGEVQAAKAGDATATNPDRPDMSDAELEAEIQRLSSRLATSRQTQADHQTGGQSAQADQPAPAPNLVTATDQPQTWPTGSSEAS